MENTVLTIGTLRLDDLPGNKKQWVLPISEFPNCSSCRKRLTGIAMYCKSRGMFWCKECDDANIGYRTCHAFTLLTTQDPKIIEHMHYKVLLEIIQKEVEQK